MDHFRYQDGWLWCESMRADQVAEVAGTPCYVYSRATLLDHYRRLRETFAALDPLICYSIKSCANLSICRLLGAEGAGMDVVSGGELHRAMAAGVPAGRCVYAGVGKSDAEIQAALQAGVGVLNIESEEEFENVSRIAGRLGRGCRAALRINPDVDPKTHRYTTTGRKETKFGVDLERARAFFRRYGRDPLARLEGLHLHIGSPIYSPQPYVESIRKALQLKAELESEGFQIRTLDMGGGFGADYESGQTPPWRDYATAIVPLLQPHHAAGLQIILEPGRTLVANAGVLLTRILYMKHSGDRRFAICDAGMQTLLRPSHYEAFHFIWPANPGPDHQPARRGKDPGVPGLTPVDVVGPLCETGDFLALERPLPSMKRGDLLAIYTAGAYGMSMASRYNSTPLPAEVLVDGAEARVIRRRETYEDLVAHETAIGA